MTSFLLTLVTVLAVVTSVSGIKCYECNSELYTDELNYDTTDPCLDPFFGDGEVAGAKKDGVQFCECDVCVKVKAEIKRAGNTEANSCC